MSPDTETWLDKIQKLLAKAERTDSQEEAEAFSAKAQELMLRHAIDQATLEAFTGTKRQDKVIEITIPHKGIFRSAQRYMTSRIGKAFGFKTLQLKLGNTDYAYWIGFESDVRDAEVIAASLLIQAHNAMTRKAEEWKQWGYDKQELYVARRSFLQTFGETVGKRIAETRKRVEAEVAAEVGENKLLPVLVSRDEQINVTFQAMYPDVKKGRRSSQRFDFGAGRAGRDAGSRADIGSPAVAPRKAVSR